MDPITRLNAALEGRYRIESELGEGGMATVYLADDVKHERKVALKVLKPELAAVIGAERFLAEIKTTANLQHPHILPLFDSGEADKFLFYVMPYVEGESLRERLDREHQLPVDDAVRIATDVAEALEDAHAHGVIHRDIKPANILLHAGRPMIADFGIALAVSAGGGSRLTETGLSLGTPHYMSPEQATGDQNIGPATDIYALGCVLYEMLVGEPPFTGSTPQAILGKIIVGESESVTAQRNSVPANVDAAISKALEKLPADRFPSLGDFNEALSDPHFAHGERNAAPVVSGTGPRFLPAVAGTSSRRPYAIAGGIALIAAAAFAFGWIPTPGGGPAPLPTIGRSTRITTGNGLATHGTISPDGSLVAFAAGQATRMRVYIQPVGGGRTIALSDDSTAFEYQPRWSPDGTQILYLTPEGVRVASSLGGASRLVAGRSDEAGPLTASDPNAVQGIAWAPDGQRVFVARGGALFIASLDGGPETRLGVLPFEVHSCDWSPSGRWIACTSGNSQSVVPGRSYGNLAPSVIVVIDTEDGTARQLTERTTLNQSPVWSPDGSRLYYVSNAQGPRDIYALDIGRDGEPTGEPRRVTTGLGAISIALSADGTRLIYVEYAARANIWTLPIPTSVVSASTATRLTNDDQVVEAVLVSPDGQWLVYDSNIFGNADIFRIPIDGGTPERLTDHPRDDFAATVSPDGSTIAFHSWRTGTRDIFVQPLGGQAQQVTDSDSQESYPMWSPDGSALLFLDQLIEGGVNRGLHVVGSDGAGGWGEPSLVRAGTGAGRWMPDGSVVYAVLETGSIEIRRADGGSLRVVYEPRPGSDDPRGGRVVIPSEDGRSIYFKALAADGNATIWSVPASGGRPTLLVSFEDLDRPSIRPDFGAGAGRFFFTLEDRRSVVWVIDLEVG